MKKTKSLHKQSMGESDSGPNGYESTLTRPGLSGSEKPVGVVEQFKKKRGRRRAKKSSNDR